MKLFLITRADLAPGQQAVQAAHALREFVNDHPDVDRDWYEKSKTLVLLAADNEDALAHVLREAQRRGVPAAAFFEPDLDDALTAIALAPAGERMCQNLDLALRQSAPVAERI